MFTKKMSPYGFKCPKCGMQRGYCACPAPNNKLVVCNDCQHFAPDKIGDGYGIGSCAFNIIATKEPNGMNALWRYKERHCGKFKPKCFT